MPRPFSSRRFMLQYTAVAATAVLFVFVLFRLPCHRREQALLHRQMAMLQRLITVSYPLQVPGTFPQWLARTSLEQWISSGWNITWLAPDQQVRWSAHPVQAAELPAPVRQALDEFRRNADSPAQCIRIPHAWHPRTWHVLPLAPGDADAGLLLLQAPLPRFLLDDMDFWGLALLLIGLQVLGLLVYQWRIRRHIQNLLRNTGLDDLPPVRSSDSLETWTRRYVASAAREIAEDRDLFDALFELLQDGILLLDAGDRILRANSAAAKMLGPSAAALAGQALADTPGHEPLAALAREIREGAQRRTGELLLPGAPEPCRVSGALLPPGPNGETHLLFVLRDLTQLRRLETAGEEYATNVSHELKTPLTLILGYTETLLSHSEMDVEFRERSLRTIERHAKRIIRIVDDLLRLAWLRNEAGLHGIPRAPVNVAEVLTDATATCREWARSAGIAIETSAPPDLVWPLNSGLIEEAIVNLVKNAILYALEGPVEVRARLLPAGSLEISVTDRGPGLQPEDAQRIFDRFYRADKSRSRASGGSGLGLPIVQQIVEAHDGRARVETAPGAGCTFILEFPPPPA